MKSTNHVPFGILSLVMIVAACPGCRHDASVTDCPRAATVDNSISPAQTIFSEVDGRKIVSNGFARTRNITHFRLNEGFKADPVKNRHGSALPKRTVSDPVKIRIDNEPHEVEPDGLTHSAAGTASLRDILGLKEYIHVFNSLNGICGDEQHVSFERTNELTILTFETGLQASVKDSTGEILVDPDLPDVSDNELADLTWEEMETSGDLGRWQAVLEKTNPDGTVVRYLSEVRLDEIRRVSDKAFVAWTLVVDPLSEDECFTQLLFWVDVRSRKIVSKRIQIHESPPLLHFGTEVQEER